MSYLVILTPFLNLTHPNKIYTKRYLTILIFTNILKYQNHVHKSYLFTSERDISDFIFEIVILNSIVNFNYSTDNMKNEKIFKYVN